MKVKNVELSWLDENGRHAINLEPYQLWAIHQILGLQIVEAEDGEYDVSYFSEETVIKRVRKAGILAEKEEV